MKNNYLAGKIFLVTGAGSGLGLETTRILLQNNAIVYAMIRKPAYMENLVKEPGRNLFIFKGDVSKEKDCKKFIDTVIKKQKQIHGIIHCAGVGLRSHAKDVKHDVFENIMGTNFYSTVYLYKASRDFLEKNHGHFVAVSSMQALVPVPFRAVYSASKHALNAYINCIRVEDKKIHFLCVNYGYIKTNFSFNALDGYGKKYGKDSKGQVKGIDVTRAAKIMIAAMIKKKREISPAGFPEKLALKVFRLVPFLYYRLISHYAKLE